MVKQLVISFIDEYGENKVAGGRMLRDYTAACVYLPGRVCSLQNCLAILYSQNKFSD